jgi:uncharacterized protein YjbJ (UPF0337 family)
MRTSLSKFAAGWLLSASPVVAQTTAPASAPASSGGMGWLWVVLLLALVAGAVWYFWFRNKPSRTSSMSVDRDRLAGSGKQVRGSVKDSIGSVLGDTKLQAEGKLDKAEGRAQNTVGSMRDTLRGK